MEQQQRGTLILDASLLAYPLLDVARLIQRAHLAMLDDIDIVALHPRALRVPRIDVAEALHDLAGTIARVGWRAALVLLPSLPHDRRAGDRLAAIADASRTEPQRPASFLTITPIKGALPPWVEVRGVDLLDDPDRALDEALERLQCAGDQPW